MHENPYLQYFIGLKEFQNTVSFGASTMVDFHKRIYEDMLIEINELILKEGTLDIINNSDDNNDNNSDMSNKRYY